MEKIKSLIVRLIQDEKGQDMVEYALLAGFIAVAAGAILPTVSQRHLDHLLEDGFGRQRRFRLVAVEVPIRHADGSFGGRLSFWSDSERTGTAAISPSRRLGRSWASHNQEPIAVNILQLETRSRS